MKIGLKFGKHSFPGRNDQYVAKLLFSVHKGPLFLLKSGNGLKIRIIISFLTKINNPNAKRQKRKEKIRKNALT